MSGECVGNLMTPGISHQGRKVGAKNKKGRASFGAACKTTNYNPMNISRLVVPIIFKSEQKTLSNTSNKRFDNSYVARSQPL